MSNCTRCRMAMMMTWWVEEDGGIGVRIEGSAGLDLGYVSRVQYKKRRIYKLKCVFSDSSWYNIFIHMTVQNRSV